MNFVFGRILRVSCTAILVASLTGTCLGGNSVHGGDGELIKPLVPKSPMDVLNALSTSPFPMVLCESVPTFDWKRSEIEQGIERIDDAQPCAGAMSTTSSVFPMGQKSTMAREVRMIVLGYMVGRYPPRIDGTRLSDSEVGLVDEYVRNLQAFRASRAAPSEHPLTADAEIEQVLMLSLADHRTGRLKDVTVSELVKRLSQHGSLMQRSGVVWGDHYETLIYTIAQLPGEDDVFSLELLTTREGGKDLPARRVINARLTYTSASGVTYYNQLVGPRWPIELARSGEAGK